jgi:hypothetical protein
MNDSFVNFVLFLVWLWKHVLGMSNNNCELSKPNKGITTCVLLRKWLVINKGHDYGVDLFFWKEVDLKKSFPFHFSCQSTKRISIDFSLELSMKWFMEPKVVLPKLIPINHCH